MILQLIFTLSLLHFIFNPSDGKVIYVVDRWNNAKINQSNFMMGKSTEQILFFMNRKVLGELLFKC